MNKRKIVITPSFFELAFSAAILTDGASKITASMLKDVERGGPIEADHIIGDLIARAPTDALPTLLPIVLVHLKAYEARRARELATAPR